VGDDDLQARFLGVRRSSTIVYRGLRMCRRRRCGKVLLCSCRCHYSWERQDEKEFTYNAMTGSAGTDFDRSKRKIKGRRFTNTFAGCEKKFPCGGGHSGE